MYSCLILFLLAGYSHCTLAVVTYNHISNKDLSYFCYCT